MGLKCSHFVVMLHKFPTVVWRWLWHRSIPRGGWVREGGGRRGGWVREGGGRRGGKEKDEEEEKVSH